MTAATRPRLRRPAATTALLAASVLVATLVVVGACGSGPKDRAVEVELWHTMTPDESETLRTVIEDFEQSNPDIDVVALPIGFDGAREKVLDALRDDTGPDVFRADAAWLPAMASEGLVASLDDVDEDRFTRAALDLTSWRGHRYGVPQTVDAVALLGTRDLLARRGTAELPTTYDELMAACERVGTGSGVFLRGEAHFVKPWLSAFGGGTVDVGEQRILVSSLPTVAALGAYRDLFTSTCAASNEDFATEARRSVELLASGEVAMAFEGPWAIDELLAGEAFADPANLLVGMPEGPAGGGSVLGAHAWSVAAGSDQDEAARRLATWLGSPQSQQRFATDNHLLPTDRSVLDDVTADDPILARFAEIVASSPVQRPTIEEVVVNAELTPRIHRVLEGEDPAIEALFEVGLAYRERFPGFEDVR